MSSNSDFRPAIPEGIKREVRKRCGFGCVICGFPIYSYEHMLEWAEVKRHVADEITLLCDRHHREKTSKLMPVAIVKRANEKPFNLNKNSSQPYDLYYEGEFVVGVLGGNSFMASLTHPPYTLHFITIDGVSLLNFVAEDGHILLNANLFDKEGRTILVIENNSMVYSLDKWDISFVGRNLIIRQGNGDIALDIVFEVPNKVRVNRAHFIFNGVEIEIYPDRVDLIPSYISISSTFGIMGNMGISIGKRIGNASAVIGIDEPVRHPE